MTHFRFPQWLNMGVREERLIWDGLDTPKPIVEPSPVEGEPEFMEEGDTGHEEGGDIPFDGPEKAAEDGTGAAENVTEKSRVNVEKANRVKFETQLDSFVKEVPAQKQSYIDVYEQMPPKQKQITVLALDGLDDADQKARFIIIMGQFSEEHNRILQKVAGGPAQQAAFLEKLTTAEDKSVLEEAMQGLNDQEKIKIFQLAGWFRRFPGDVDLLKQGCQIAAEQLQEQKGDQMAESFAKFLTMLSEFMEQIMKFFKDVEDAMKGKYHKEDGKDGGKDAKDVSPEVRKEQIAKRLKEINERMGKIDGKNGDLKKAEQNHTKLKEQKAQLEAKPTEKFEDIAAREQGEKLMDSKISKAEANVQRLEEERESLVEEQKKLNEELGKLDEKAKESPKGEGAKPAEAGDKAKITPEQPKEIDAVLKKQSKQMVSNIVEALGVQLSEADKSQVASVIEQKFAKLTPTERKSFSQAKLNSVAAIKASPTFPKGKTLDSMRKSIKKYNALWITNSFLSIAVLSVYTDVSFENLRKLLLTK